MQDELWEVALLGAPYSTLTYKVPKYFPATTWQSGLRVFVPLGRSLRVGVLLGSGRISGLDSEKVRPLLWPLERDPLLDAQYLELIQEMAKRVACEPGLVLSAALPSGLRSTQKTLACTGGQDRVRFPSRQLLALSESKKQDLVAQWALGRANWATSSRFDHEHRVYRVSQDPPWPVRPGAKRQKQVLDYLWDKGPVGREQVRKDLGGWVTPVLSALSDKKLVEIVPLQENGPIDAFLPCPLDEFELTSEQSQALELLGQAAKAHRAALVYGITGSGKTLIYAHLIRRGLEKGQDSLVLVPEVALAKQISAAMRNFLPGQDIHLYHGYQPAGQRERVFTRLAGSRRAKVVVGTRSALFLPLPRLGLIVIDEEHSESFKQDERLVYQAKEIAFFRIQQSRGFLVLGSATPDLKTFYAVDQGQLPMTKLQRRISGNSPPEVELVDLRKDPPAAGPFATPVHDELQRVLAAGEQAIIMHNRRGYAPLVYCTGCGEVARCQHCQVGLTYHKQRQCLVCHYCGAQKEFPFVCPKCRSSQFVPLGEGTEQIEEYLSNELPEEVRVDRLDRDSTRRQGSLDKILDAFSQGVSQVLVGTQMLSKGHHFPGVTLVIVVDGDLGLNLPDYRATERTFQMLVQVSGRAGRGPKSGRVLIQTRNPDHYCWRYIRNGDYEGFYSHELSLRKGLLYPPFTKLALIRLSYPEHWGPGAEVVHEAGRLLRELGPQAGLRVLGPAPAPLGRLRGRLRYHCLLKGERWQDIRWVFQNLRNNFESLRHLRISLDLDPVQML